MLGAAGCSEDRNVPRVLLDCSVKWHVIDSLWNFSDLIKMHLLAGNGALILRNFHLAKSKPCSATEAYV